MALPGMNPLTGVLVGLVCQEIDPRAGFALAGIGLVVTAGLAWRVLGDTPAVGAHAVLDPGDDVVTAPAPRDARTRRSR